VSARISRIALLALIVGLALHNLAMALLWDAGVRDTVLDAVAAWKDVLLLIALEAALVAAGSLPALGWPDRLALAYGAIVVVYWLLPQSWLDGTGVTRWPQPSSKTVATRWLMGLSSASSTSNDGILSALISSSDSELDSRAGTPTARKRAGKNFT
jgi:hypothetical protein